MFHLYCYAHYLLHNYLNSHEIKFSLFGLFGLLINSTRHNVHIGGRKPLADLKHTSLTLRLQPHNQTKLFYNIIVI